MDPVDHTLKSTPNTKAETLKVAGLGKDQPLQFTYEFSEETEIAGHIVAKLVMGVESRADGTHPKDIDVFVTLRHIDSDGSEVFYTGE